MRIWLVFLCFIVTACSAQQSETSDAPKSRPVKLVTVKDANLYRLLNFPAVIESEQSSELTFQVSGQIVSLRVLEGDEISKGDIIATLEERDFQNTLTQAQVQFQNAENEYQRAKRLSDQDAISRSLLESRETQRDVAKATLDSAKKTRGDTVLRAPFNGYISRVFVEQHQNIQAKEAIAIVQGDGVQAVIDAPADIIARSHQFKPLVTYVELDAAPNVKIPAEFKEASGLADAATQTFKAVFTFTPPPELIVLPGMTATLFTGFDFNDMSDIVPDGMEVPISAIISEGNEKFVWKVDPSSMTISKQIVQAGEGMDMTDVTVTKGLENGDIIVAAGGAFLHEGMLVRAWEPR